jgi:hypothetical protein
MRLGFAEDRVLECLKALQNYDLEEAFDWVCVTGERVDQMH